MKAIVTGSFDPFTLGHLEIVKKALKSFDNVYVVALINEAKDYMFSMDEKKEIIRLSTKELDNVTADAYTGMTCDYMHKHGIKHIVRGVRNENDLRYEENLANQMKSFDKDFETVFIECDKEFNQISSTVVREIIEKKGDLAGYIHPCAISYIEKIK